MSPGWSVIMSGALDFEREITGIASQPFWLYWTGKAGPATARPGLLRPAG